MGGCSAKKSPSQPNSAQPRDDEKKITKQNVQIVDKDLIGLKAEKFTKVYKFTEMLGQGAFGEVRKAIHKTNKKVFAKNMTEEDEKAILQEIEIMKNVDHPNIIKIYEYYSEPKLLYIVMEFCDGGELFDRKIYITDQNVALIARKLLSAIAYSHAKKITHRDLKPQNILYEKKDQNSDIKVVDWGLSTFFKDNEKFDKIMGTPLYMSPEIAQKSFDEKADIWAIGMTLFQQITEIHPFVKGCNSINDLLSKIKIGTIDFDEYADFNLVSSDCKKFVQSLLTVDPEKRPSAQQALDCKWMENFSKTEKIQFKVEAQKSLQHLSSFQTQNKMQQATWVFFSQFFATEDQKEELKKAFIALDKNNDGLLSHEELRNGMHLFLSADQPEEEITKLIDQIDSNKNGKIDYNEFVQAAINREKIICQENIKKAFKMLDTDNSGKISVAEYKALFCGSVVPEDVWKEMFKDVDENGDQEISLSEFQKIIENIGQKMKSN